MYVEFWFLTTVDLDSAIGFKVYDIGFAVMVNMEFLERIKPEREGRRPEQQPNKAQGGPGVSPPRKF